MSGVIDPFTPVVTSDPEAEEAMREIGLQAALRDAYARWVQFQREMAVKAALRNKWEAESRDAKELPWSDLARPHSEGDFKTVDASQRGVDSDERRRAAVDAVREMNQFRNAGDIFANVVQAMSEGMEVTDEHAGAVGIHQRGATKTPTAGGSDG